MRSEKHNVSEELASITSKGPNWVGFVTQPASSFTSFTFFTSPEYGNRSSFWNVVFLAFYRIIHDGQSPKPSNSWKLCCGTLGTIISTDQSVINMSAGCDLILNTECALSVLYHRASWLLWGKQGVECSSVRAVLLCRLAQHSPELTIPRCHLPATMEFGRRCESVLNRLPYLTLRAGLYWYQW
jgi:hypothetical protein